MCSKWIEEKQVEWSMLSFIPEVFLTTKRGLEDQKYAKELMLLQLNNFETVLRYNIEQSKDSARKKVKEFF